MDEEAYNDYYLDTTNEFLGCSDANIRRILADSEKYILRGIGGLPIQNTLSGTDKKFGHVLSGEITVRFCKVRESKINTVVNTENVPPGIQCRDNLKTDAERESSLSAVKHESNLNKLLSCSANVKELFESIVAKYQREVKQESSWFSQLCRKLTESLSGSLTVETRGSPKLQTAVWCGAEENLTSKHSYPQPEENSILPKRSKTLIDNLVSAKKEEPSEVTSDKLEVCLTKFLTENSFSFAQNELSLPDTQGEDPVLKSGTVFSSENKAEILQTQFGNYELESQSKDGHFEDGEYSSTAINKDDHSHTPKDKGLPGSQTESVYTNAKSQEHFAEVKTLNEVTKALTDMPKPPFQKHCSEVQVTEIPKFQKSPLQIQNEFSGNLTQETKLKKIQTEEYISGSGRYLAGTEIRRCPSEAFIDIFKTKPAEVPAEHLSVTSGEHSHSKSKMKGPLSQFNVQGYTTSEAMLEMTTNETDHVWNLTQEDPSEFLTKEIPKANSKDTDIQTAILKIKTDTFEVQKEVESSETQTAVSSLTVNATEECHSVEQSKAIKIEAGTDPSEIQKPEFTSKTGTESPQVETANDTFASPTPESHSNFQIQECQSEIYTEINYKYSEASKEGFSVTLNEERRSEAEIQECFLEVIVQDRPTEVLLGMTEEQIENQKPLLIISTNEIATEDSEIQTKIMKIVTDDCEGKTKKEHSKFQAEKRTEKVNQEIPSKMPTITLGAHIDPSGIHIQYNILPDQIVENCVCFPPQTEMECPASEFAETGRVPYLESATKEILPIGQNETSDSRTVSHNKKYPSKRQTNAHGSPPTRNENSSKFEDESCTATIETWPTSKTDIPQIQNLILDKGKLQKKLSDVTEEQSSISFVEDNLRNLSECASSLPYLPIKDITKYHVGSADSGETNSSNDVFRRENLKANDNTLKNVSEKTTDQTLTEVQHSSPGITDPAYCAGDKICEFSPFVYVLDARNMQIRCSCCVQVLPPRNRTCKRCTLANYCSRECQEKHHGIHKKECPYLRRALKKNSIPADFIRLIANVLWKLEDPSSKNAYNTVGNKRYYYKNLPSNTHNLSSADSELKALMEVQYEEFQSFVYDGSISFEKFCNAYGKVSKHIAGIKGNPGEKIGIGMYFGLTVFRHSCRPNANVISIGTTARIIASSDIEDLQKVTIRCISIMLPKETRQHLLKVAGGDSCSCELCQGEEFEAATTEVASKPESDSIMSFVKRTLNLCENMTPKDYERIKKISCEAVASLKGIAGDMNFIRGKTLQIAAKSCIKLKNYEEAIVYIEQLIPFYRYVYGANHPLTMGTLLNLSLAHLKTGNPRKAREYYLEALQTAYNIYGWEHWFFKKVRYEFIQMEIRNWETYLFTFVVEGC